MASDINDARREYGAEVVQKMLDEAIHKFRSTKQHQPNDDSQLAPAFSDEALALRFAN